jgi:hypothetical protein
MNNTTNNLLICPSCDNRVKQADEFCTRCGTLFEEDVRCIRHGDQNSDGVCVMCCLPFCSECGGVVNCAFLCEDHYLYEIYEGMARVYGVLDDTQAQYVQLALNRPDFIHSCTIGIVH